MRFDGRKFAQKIENEVREEVLQLKGRPLIVSVLVGNDAASELYTKLKKQMAERVGIGFEVLRLEEGVGVDRIKNEIESLNQRDEVGGIMVQMPIPGMSRQIQNEIVSSINIDKDVDGLRWEESGVMPATVRAVILILSEIEKSVEGLWEKRVVVVGDRGSVGRPLVHYLRQRGVEVLGVNSETVEPMRTVLAGEIVIACTGKEGLIDKEMVRDSVIAIDVGAPRGEMTSGVYEKARVSVEVPGGVGPVTVVSLMKNMVELGERDGR